MSPIPLKNLFLLPLLSTFFAGAFSSPAAYPNQYVEHALKKRAALDVVKTTTTHAHTIDWVPIESQGEIAKPPPPPANLPADPTKKVTRPQSELEIPGVEQGPAGTVPVPRVNATYLQKVNGLKKPPPSKQGVSRRQDAGDHWYVSSNQNVNNNGGNWVMSMFKPFVNNNGDFSLLQTAVTYTSSNGLQTLEAGWINYPDQVSEPHIFTYYTTDGYSSEGNDVGGWNQDVAGWVQTDSTYFPGTVFSSIATIGGTQYDLMMQYYLYEGNWWLYVIDRYIGYYPASLYSNGVSGGSLSTGSDAIFFYGEIYQSEAPLTTTDMGSGEFAQTGFGYSGYIHNM
jgi:hypothetical protein